MLSLSEKILRKEFIFLILIILIFVAISILSLIAAKVSHANYNASTSAQTKPQQKFHHQGNSPTPLPTSSANPLNSSTGIEGIPICTDHNPDKWHPLVKKDAAGNITCTYGHEHHDDPNSLNSLFGTPGQWAGINASISYPWQTTSALGHENHAKHNFYKWGVVSVDRCYSAFAPLSFNAVRLQTHSDGIYGATVRFHSFSVEAMACDSKDPNYKGYIKTGGHLDYGALFIDNAGSRMHIPLPVDPSQIIQGGNRRVHAGPNSNKKSITWYGSHKLAGQIGINAEDSGGLDPNNLNTINFFGGNFNHSEEEPVHLLAMRITPDMDNWDKIKDGKFKMKGFTDRYGNLVSSCSPIGPDCIPLDIDLKVGTYQFRMDGFGVHKREYDVRSPITGKSLIQSPN